MASSLSSDTTARIRRVERLRAEYAAASILFSGATRRLEDQCRSWFNECDQDGSGGVSAAEFVSKVLLRNDGSDYEDLRRELRAKVELYRTLDRDGDHSVTLAEMIAWAKEQ